MLELYQIAINNPYEFNNLLQRYNLPVIDHPAEIAQAVDYASENMGSNFIADLQSIKNNGLAQTEASYKSQLDSSNYDQLNTELIKWDVKLRQCNDIAGREYALDKIAYIQKLMLNKKDNSTTNTLSIHKNNQTLLLVLTAVALMFVGSKIFKQ